MIGAGREVSIGDGGGRGCFVPLLVGLLQPVAESDGFGIGKAHCVVADLHARRVCWERDTGAGRVELVVGSYRLDCDWRRRWPFFGVTCRIEPHRLVASCEPQSPIASLDRSR